MHKLLILDKEGAITVPKSGAKFVQNPTDQKLLPRTKETIARYATDGWKIAIVSNQCEVAAGHKTLKDAIQEMSYCLFLIDYSSLMYAYFCPDFEGRECYQVGWEPKVNQPTPCVYEVRYKHVHAYCRHLVGSFRKPGPGMIEAVSFFHANEPPLILFVSDRAEDKAAAKSAGAYFLSSEEWRGDRSSVWTMK
ncbi:hypothetical protein NDI52_28925 [Leptolyngbya sp. PL-A3]|uniref:HAD family hydrolase n=1 Tax=Leptolyngbya sp. PL-A3 TaxID=2933911 RepID=UPI00329A5310